MLKYFFLTFLIYLCEASVINAPSRLENGEFYSSEEITPKIDLWEKWGTHIMEFAELVDMEKVMGVVMEHINDPDVINFIGFVFSPQFKEIIRELESLDEFKEAIEYFHSKGYDAKAIVDLINSLIDLPLINSRVTIENGKGVTELIEAVIKELPIEDMKVLLKHKLETNQDIAMLFETLTSEELAGILKRFIENPKCLEIRKVFESYGFDFDRLSVVFEGIFGGSNDKIHRNEV